MSTDHELPESQAALLATTYTANYHHGVQYGMTHSAADLEMRASIDDLQKSGHLVVDNRTDSDDVLTLTCKGIDYVETHHLVSPELIKTHQAVRHGLVSAQQRAREGDQHAERHWEEEVRRNDYHSDLLHFTTVIYVRERSKYCA